MLRRALRKIRRAALLICLFGWPLGAVAVYDAHHRNRRGDHAF